MLRSKPFGRLAVFVLVCLIIATVAEAQMVTGRKMKDFDAAFGLNNPQESGSFDARLISSGAPGNVLYPGEQPKLTIELVRVRAEPIVGEGTIEIIHYGTKGTPGDIWRPTVFSMGVVDTIKFPINLANEPRATISVDATVPETFGAYAVVVELPGVGRRFSSSFIRTFKATPYTKPYTKLTTDVNDIELNVRLGVSPNRIGWGFKSSEDQDFEKWYAGQVQRAEFSQLKAAGLGVSIEFGHGLSWTGRTQPMGVARPWLDDKGVVLASSTKPDLAWLPEYDAEFKKMVKRMAIEHGYPKGPIIAMKLWNEPWEGVSISHWGADMLRYREIYTVMCEAVEEARAEAGVQVLLGGCDSSSNTLDKLFPDGKNDFLERLDFLSIHYQGLGPFSTYKPFLNKAGGRVLIWDTESWVANVDDRVATVVATNYATGHDRAVGIYGGNIAGRKDGIRTTWSVAASVGAVQHFIGERDFSRMLFMNGLPWVMVFDGLPDEGGAKNPDDGTIVVVGNIGEAFGKDSTLFRTVKPLADRQATLSIAADGTTYALHDFYGNPVVPVDGRIVIPLDHRGFYLRTDRSKGSFDKLLKAVASGRIDGHEPVEIVAHDLLAPIDQKPSLRLKITNVLNRPITGQLGVTLGTLKLELPAEVAIGGNESKWVEVKITGGDASPANAYPLSVTFDAGADGAKTCNEEIRVNVIARRTISVDGKLDEWNGVLPQTVVGTGESNPTLQEFAWQPFKEFDKGVAGGVATAYLAYDEQHFYFAAKVADSTPDAGMRRRDDPSYDDAFFYPEVAYRKVDETKPVLPANFSVRWTGYLEPQVGGKHNLILTSDDGIRLWIDGKQVIDQWASGGGNKIAEVELEAGKRVVVRLEYFQGGGSARTQLKWTQPGGKPTIIPTESLFLNAQGGDQGLNAEFFSGTELSGKPRGNRIDVNVNYAAWKTADVPGGPKIVDGVEELRWPEGVRRYSYRTDPELPAGNFPRRDNVQIAFNVLSDDEKMLLPSPPGTPRHFTGYQCTDYEYALNPIALAFGGGVELFRLSKPGMPIKHHYPRQPKSPLDGAVKDAKLAISREGNTRVVECAILWTEIPHVKAKLDSGEPIKFSYRVNDNGNSSCMELSRGRSVSKRNNSFQVHWVEHWSNELEFAFEK